MNTKLESNITKKQKEVLDFIKKYSSEHGFPPAIREIGAGLGLSSPATVHSHVKKLEEAGCIRTSSNKFRTIELLVDNEFDKSVEDVVRVPLLGKVTAGNPIEAIEQPDEYFALPANLVPSKEQVFTLLVSGDSMINAGIHDGDIIIVKKQNTCHNGEMVVAMTDDFEVTLKTFYKEKDHIRLQPENDLLSPIILNTCTILGKAIGLFRKI